MMIKMIINRKTVLQNFSAQLFGLVCNFLVTLLTNFNNWPFNL